MLDTTVLAKWELSIDGQATVSVPGSAQIHHDEISAYPNPARQFGGRVRFDLKESGPVDVIVADVAGRKVAQLSSGYQFAGPHEITLEGSAGDGRELASGTYFVKLERNGTELARSKLTIVR